VSTWALHADLERFAQGPDPALAEIARRVATAYEYPVDSMVLSPAGEINAHCAAMEALMDGSAYVRMLDAGGEER
jgi:hypothetical protein